MNKLLRIIATAVLGIGLSAGMVAAQAEIDTTGPRSDNVIRYDNDTDVDIDNDNDVDVDVDTDQDADSGDATVRGNTTGGDAETGDARNSSDTNVRVAISNEGLCDCLLGHNGFGGGNGDARISNTGPRSDNRIIFDNRVDVDVDNDNDVDVDVDTDQDARSGDATVRGNTTGGDATTGNASNTSSSSVNVSVQN